MDNGLKKVEKRTVHTGDKRMIKNKICKICVIIAVLSLVSLLFAGAGAAALTDTETKLVFSNGEAINGTIVPGSTVSATVSFTINVNDLSVGDILRVDTPFETPWQADVTVKGKTLTFTDVITNKRPTLDCINFLNVGPNATVTVRCSGTIPESAGGSTIAPLSVTLKSKNSSAGGTAQTDSVDVYNTAEIASDIVKGLQQVSTLSQRINKYNTPDVVALGISFAIPEKYLSDAGNYLSQAQRSDVSEYIAANSIIEANKKIQSAENSINEIILQIATQKLNLVKSLINDLKGLNVDVDNISTKYTVYKSTLERIDLSTDPSKVDELITDINDLYNDAYNKKIQAENTDKISVITSPNSSYIKGEKISFVLSSATVLDTSATLEGTQGSGNSVYIQNFAVSGSNTDNKYNYSFTLDTASTPVGNYTIIVKENGNVWKTFPTNVVAGTANGTVSVESSPSGATVYVDGVKSGITPASFPLNSGNHQIMVTKDGYENWEQQVTISANTVSKVEVTLKKSSDIISFDSPYIILIIAILALGIVVVIVVATLSSRKRRVNKGSSPYYEMKTKCPYCGSDISENSNFCSNCGRRLR